MRIASHDFEDLVARRIHEWQISQKRLAEQPAATEDALRRVVTLSRELGSGGNETAQILYQETGWALWDRQIVEEIGRSAHVRTRVVDSVDEHVKSEIAGIVDGLIGEDLGEIGYRRHLIQLILTIARHGKAIIVGRGANYVLLDALNVRIVAPLKQRAARVAHREGIPEEEAHRRCLRSDHERAHYVRALFGKDINDPAGYDLVINTGELQPGGAASVIITATRQRFG